MNALQVRTDQVSLSVTFNLNPFLFDWDAARRAFCAGAGEHLQWLNPRPGDFSSASPDDHGEAWCRYRLLGDQSNIITLKPDCLNLSFENVADAYSIVLEVLRTTVERLLPVLGGYERHNYSVLRRLHASVLSGRCDAYLSLHESGVFSVEESDGSMLQYRPVVGFCLRSGDGQRVMQRTMEQSVVLQNGLFISDSIYVELLELTGFDEEQNWVEDAIGRADRTSGVVWQREGAVERHGE